MNLTRFFTAPGLVFKIALKKNESKLDLLNAIIMLLMVETSITGGTCHAIYWYAKANNKYKKQYSIKPKLDKDIFLYPKI